jgi:FeS assembly SUF system regulator
MIRLTRQSDYGIVLMTRLAAQPEPGQSAPELAGTLEIPLPMVSKILKLLAKEGLLVSQRGAKGGYSLARPAQEISIADIIESLEGPIAITDCTDETVSAHDCSRESICTVRGHWHVINQAVARALRAVKLADMVHPHPPQNLVLLGGSRLQVRESA